MDLISNELIFYSGLIITGITVIAAVIFFFVSRISGRRLKAKLDEEYGPQEKRSE